MTLHIQNFRSEVPFELPNSLLPGEIAFNLADNYQFIGDGSNTRKDAEGNVILPDPPPGMGFGTFGIGGGTPGPPGPTGPQGPDGPQGQDGQDGAPGDQGPPGIQGSAGPQGPAGSKGDTGAAGSRGPEGPIGPEGPPGTGIYIQGTVPTAANLPTPSTIGYAYQTLDTGDLWIYTLTGWEDFGQLRGPQGPQGPSGPTGAAGAPGATGATGPAGANGAQGPRGSDGDPGPAGADGDPATVSVGTTTTGFPGTSASVVNAGTVQNAVLNFTIPAGINGTNGVGVPLGGLAGQILTKTSSSNFDTAWTSNSTTTNVKTTAVGLSNASNGNGVFIGYLAGGQLSGGGSTTQSNVVVGNQAGRNFNGAALNNVIVGGNAGQNITGGSGNVIVGHGAGTVLTVENNQIVIGTHNGKEDQNNIAIFGTNSHFLSLDTLTGGLSFSNYNKGTYGQALTSNGAGSPPTWRSKSYLQVYLTQDQIITTPDGYPLYSNMKWSVVEQRGDAFVFGVQNLGKSWFTIRPGTYKATIDLAGYNFTSGSTYVVWGLVYSTGQGGNDWVSPLPILQNLVFSNNRDTGETEVPSCTGVFTVTAAMEGKYFGLNLREISGAMTMRANYCSMLIEEY
jgi:hypothetical protein